ncbi:ankyrin repeat domain-containing protein [Flavobacteriaceae bacterium AU392]|nr:ankyrin repeat domain-containing protein [Flavobacteriaceae bacterium]RKM82875.1 ankyrin repeat domain-containing protein [Flavobacteriaceae bacterium AU392]
MRKSLVIIAIALGFTAMPANASTFLETKTNSEASFVEGKVNAFCLSVAKGDIDTVKKLISLGTDVNEKSNGMTPLHYAAKYNRVEILKLLVENGAKLNKRCDKGNTAVEYAKLSNAKDAIAVLNELKAAAKKKRRS